MPHILRKPSHNWAEVPSSIYSPQSVSVITLVIILAHFLVDLACELHGYRVCSHSSIPSSHMGSAGGADTLAEMR